jgi:hypothetical protein
MLAEGPQYEKSPVVACIVVTKDNLGGARFDGKWVGGDAGGYSEPNRVKKHLKVVNGFSRGHLIADSYFGKDEDKRKTYYTINQIPQLQQCNGGWWANSVEAKVSAYMHVPHHLRGPTMVFVGSHGTVPAFKPNFDIVPTDPPKVRHRQYMWTAVCQRGQGFFFVASSPNDPDCAPHVLDGNSAPPDLAGVIASLRRVCGPSVWAWDPTPGTPLPVKAVPSTGSAYTRSGGGEMFPERRHDVGYSRSTAPVRVARPGGGGHIGGHTIMGADDLADGTGVEHVVAREEEARREDGGDHRGGGGGGGRNAMQQHALLIARATKQHHMGRNKRREIPNHKSDQRRQTDAKRKQRLQRRY